MVNLGETGEDRGNDQRDREPVIQSPHSVHSRAEGASIVQVETLGKGGAFILWAAAFISALSLALAIFALIMADKAEREGRLAQYELTLIRPALRDLGVSTEDPETHEEQ